MTQNQRDLQRYKRYVKQGHTEFQPAIDYLNGKRREEPESRLRLRKAFEAMKKDGHNLDSIAEVTGLSKSCVSNVCSALANSLSEEKCERALKGVMEYELQSRKN